MKTTLFTISFLVTQITMADTAGDAAMVTVSDTASSNTVASSNTIVSLNRQNELLYFIKHDCGSCHGMTLKGGLGPALLPETLAAKPESYLVTTILEGRKNTAMPPWKTMLNQEDAIWITRQLQNGKLQQTELALNKQMLIQKNKNIPIKNKQTTGNQ